MWMNRLHGLLSYTQLHRNLLNISSLFVFRSYSFFSSVPRAFLPARLISRRFAHRGDLERSLQIINDSGGVDRVTWWEKRFGIHGSHGCQSMDSWIDDDWCIFSPWKDVSEKIRLLECGCLLCTVIKLISGKDFHLTGELIHPPLFKRLDEVRFSPNDPVVVEWRVLARLPTVDGRNPAPVDMVNIPLFYRVSYIPGAGFLPSTPYVPPNSNWFLPGKAYTLAEKMVLWLAVERVMPGSLPACLGPWPLRRTRPWKPWP